MRPAVRVLLQPVDHFPSVDARHHQVEQDDAELLTAEAFDPYPAVLRRRDGQILTLERRGDQLEQRSLILDDEYVGSRHVPDEFSARSAPIGPKYEGLTSKGDRKPEIRANADGKYFR